MEKNNKNNNKPKNKKKLKNNSKFNMNQAIISIKKNWKLTSIICGIGAATIVLIVTSSALATARSNRTLTTSGTRSGNVREGGNINTELSSSLEDFRFSINADKRKIAELSATDFVYPNNIESNVISRGPMPQNYWANQLVINSIDPTNKDFFLRAASNQAPLSIFKLDYNITIQSFANEAEGKLFLQVELKPKATNSRLAEQKQVYELSGFKKETDLQRRLLNVTPTTFFLSSTFTDNINSYTQLKTLYEQTADAEKSKFIRDRISFSVNERIAMINNNNLKLEFDDTTQKVTLKYGVNVATYSATKTELNKVDFLTIPNSERSFNVPLNFIRIKNFLSTLRFRPTEGREFNQIRESDIVYNSSSRSFSNIELFSTDSTLSASLIKDYDIVFTNTDIKPGAGDTNNLVFNFVIRARIDAAAGINYNISSTIRVPKSSLLK